MTDTRDIIAGTHVLNARDVSQSVAGHKAITIVIDLLLSDMVTKARQVNKIIDWSTAKVTVRPETFYSTDPEYANFPVLAIRTEARAADPLEPANAGG